MERAKKKCINGKKGKRKKDMPFVSTTQICAEKGNLPSWVSQDRRRSPPDSVTLIRCINDMHVLGTSTNSIIVKAKI